MASGSNFGRTVEMIDGIVTSLDDPALTADNQPSKHTILEYANKLPAKGEQDAPSEEAEPIYSDCFNLLAQDQHNEHKSIYTRQMLQYIKLQAGQINRELSLPTSQRTLQSLEASGLTKRRYKVWDWGDNAPTDTLLVDCLSRVEMHPDYQRKYSEHSTQLRLLKHYNKDCKDEYIDMPYTFSTSGRESSSENQGPDQESDKKREYQTAIKHTEGLWIESSSRDRLKATIQEIEAKPTKITNVICFGLGHINLNKDFYHSIIQHMAVFTIIDTLNELRRQRDPDHTPIRLILQDPRYTPRDHETMKWLFPYDDNISFVSDPDGLLAINSGTLLVTAYLPFSMPLMQIVADLFAEDPSQGPVAMICDEMELDADKREYSVRDRASPGVARFLMGHYEKVDAEFDGYALESDFMADVYGKDWYEQNRYYWLNSMELWARR
ncbi:hypothetical protein DDE83_005867 [Stemphylium lycopersici]|uniref:SRR1-like domain-containing protein n=1 Tax=Stemphylium lycopersici TaxID=183478 RepID=A0A364N1A1_STELY|nr:hypothetical protein DDE83_005867 [Stemphylium lycopersici]